MTNVGHVMPCDITAIGHVMSCDLMMPHLCYVMSCDGHAVQLVSVHWASFALYSVLQSGVCACVRMWCVYMCGVSVCGQYCSP